MAEPFLIAVPDDRLAAIRARVAAFDWDALPDAGGWRSGVGLADLRRLVDHWRTRSDWRAQERRLNALPHFVTQVEGQRLHFVHWTRMEAGGHFAALEQPQLLLADMRRFFADQRPSKAAGRRLAIGIAGVTGVAATGLWMLARGRRRAVDPAAGGERFDRR